MVLKGWCAELGEDFLNVPAALPQAMQASSAREHERCTTAAIQFLGMCSKVSECDPPAAVAVGNGKQSCRSVDGNGAAKVGERQEPGVMIQELGTTSSISGHFRLRGGLVERTEERNQLMSDEA